MPELHLTRIAFSLAVLFLFSDAILGAGSPAKGPGQARESELTEEEISTFIREAAAQKVKTLIPQIDILKCIYFHYRGDSVLMNGGRIIISGKKFSRAISKMENTLVSQAKAGDALVQNQIPPPEIQYGNFRAIILYARKGRTRMRIELEKGYEQEIPHTFGAKIVLARIIEAELRADREGDVTEVVFDGDSYVRFTPPSIAFFVPGVFTKIARIARQGDEIWGHVIGRPKSDPARYVSVCYNLSTCAKSSISSQEMGPREFRKKISSID